MRYFMKHLGLAVTCFFSLNCLAATPQVFKVGAAVEYLFDVNDPQIITNQFLWTIKAVCKVKIQNEENIISFKVLKKSGSLNGCHLTAGDTKEITVHQGDTLSITANSGGQVEIVNLGPERVKADCSVA